MTLSKDEYSEWDWFGTEVNTPFHPQPLIAVRFNVWTGDPQYLVRGVVQQVEIKGCLVFSKEEEGNGDS
jgi:hypothetical protein